MAMPAPIPRRIRRMLAIALALLAVRDPELGGQVEAGHCPGHGNGRRATGRLGRDRAAGKERGEARRRKATEDGSVAHASQKSYSRTRSIPPRRARSTNCGIQSSPSRWRASSTTM